MKKILLIILLLIVGCSKEPINRQKLVERDLLYYKKETNKPYSGPVYEIHKNGQIKYEATLMNGMESGDYTNWYENGQISEKGTFSIKNGIGNFIRWDENGYVSEKVTYNHGIATRIVFYDNGDKMWEWTERSGEKYGLSIRWYGDGQKKDEVNYVNGKPHGIWTFWDYDGQKFRQEIWENGEWISSKCWDEDGNEEECK